MGAEGFGAAHDAVDAGDLRGGEGDEERCGAEDVAEAEDESADEKVDTQPTVEEVLASHPSRQEDDDEE